MFAIRANLILDFNTIDSDIIAALCTYTTWVFHVIQPSQNICHVFFFGPFSAFNNAFLIRKITRIIE